MLCFEQTCYNLLLTLFAERTTEDDVVCPDSESEEELLSSCEEIESEDALSEEEVSVPIA